MQLSPALIEKINQNLRIDGRVHMIDFSAGGVDTGCYEWGMSGILSDIPEGYMEMPSTVRDAIERFVDTLGGSLAGYFSQIDRFISNEPAETQADFSRYRAFVQKAYGWQYPLPPEITYSQQLWQAYRRIEQQLHQENFINKEGRFDLKRYTARSIELFNAEPADIKEEYQVVSQMLADNQRRIMGENQPQRSTLDEVRALLEGEPAIAYRAGILWEGEPSLEYDTIVVAPTSDMWDALRIEGTQGNNFYISTEELIAVLKELDAVYGVDVTGAVRDGVEFTFKRVPKGKEARVVGKRLYEICPDLGEPPVKFPRGRVDLWWD